ncbi:hypothetical protein ABIE50_000433 [Chitinophaga sp. OAE865]
MEADCMPVSQLCGGCHCQGSSNGSRLYAGPDQQYSGHY